MAKIPLNLRGVTAAGSFPVFPAGRYTLRVEETKIETARSSGEPKLTVFFRIIDGPDGSTQFSNQRMPRSYPLKPEGAGFLKRLLDAVGIQDQHIPPDGSIEEEWLHNQVISAQVSQREYQGRKVNDLVEEAANATVAAPVAVAPSGFSAPAPAMPSGGGYSTATTTGYASVPTSTPVFSAPSQGGFIPPGMPSFAPPQMHNGGPVIAAPPPPPPVRK